MPVYEYRCPSCEHQFDVVKKVAALDDPEQCPMCAVVADRQISRVMVLGDYEPYNCPITGKEIRGRREHEENLRKHGCRVYEQGETEQFVRNKARREAEQKKEWEALVEKCVETTAQEMGIGG